ncbi:MAG: AAA family ATPase, partial [Candidatus Marinimicrobia bacterium]|nr:AAA family ATPase [Candidatus Neomarinimicrobiota bacterium]
MINRLHIRNFAIIDELDLILKPGLTVITGETGSGKSIILQALNVSLGMKPTKTMIKTGQAQAIVETSVYQSAKENTVYRVIPAKGRLKNYIDDTPVNDSDFRELTRNYADFHGQHEQQLIMNSATHIKYLDNYIGNQNTVRKLKIKFDQIEVVRKKLASVQRKQEYAVQRKELLNFQLNEITAATPIVGEDLVLAKEFSVGSHQEEIITAIDDLHSRLETDDNSVQQQLHRSVRELERLLKWDTGLKNFIKLLNDAVINLQEVSSGLFEHVQSLDFDKERLREIEDRLQALELLKRKYGGSIESVLEYKAAIEKELKVFESQDYEIEQLQQNLLNFQEEYQKLANKAHDKRSSAIKKLSDAIITEMHKLKMPGANFEIRMTQLTDNNSPVKYGERTVRSYPDGYDVIEFYLSANPGEKTKPLTQIASGGEVSRIMLAIKTVLQDSDPVDTLIFDEIDSGISG